MRARLDDGHLAASLNRIGLYQHEIDVGVHRLDVSGSADAIHHALGGLCDVLALLLIERHVEACAHPRTLPPGGDTLALTESFLRRSRDLWIKREKTYQAKAKDAHAKHKHRSEQLAAAQAAAKPKVAAPMKHILQDTWGWHPGVHDGLDLICPPNEPLYAICRSEVIRVSPSGWWGNGAPTDPVLKAKGDGIIVIRSLVDVGPIKKRMDLCYGHAEGAVVKVGQVVEAGQHIGHAGFANAWHVHFMVNTRSDALGLGDVDPAPIISYVRKNA